MRQKSNSKSDAESRFETAQTQDGASLIHNLQHYSQSPKFSKVYRKYSFSDPHSTKLYKKRSHSPRQTLHVLVYTSHILCNIQYKTKVEARVSLVKSI